ncbi:hypothetical protein [Mogibacterium pumilum]|nr:hypothetical protein [Mogibacterium pumilum]
MSGFFSKMKNNFFADDEDKNIPAQPIANGVDFRRDLTERGDTTL